MNEPPPRSRLRWLLPILSAASLVLALLIVTA
jgi:hypothetical protein